jgi:hypothetical protein
VRANVRWPQRYGSRMAHALRIFQIVEKLLSLATSWPSGEARRCVSSVLGSGRSRPPVAATARNLALMLSKLFRRGSQHLPRTRTLRWRRRSSSSVTWRAIDHGAQSLEKCQTQSLVFVTVFRTHYSLEDYMAISDDFSKRRSIQVNSLLQIANMSRRRRCSAKL